MKVTVRVDIERHVRDAAARRLAALVPNPTTVAAIEAARIGEVVEFGTPFEAIAELDRDDRRGRSPALADQSGGVHPARRVIVPDELAREHQSLDAAAVGEHGAEDVGQAQGRRALAVAPEPDHAVAEDG